MLLASLLRQCKERKEVVWNHRCSAPVEAPGHELVVEGGQVWVLGSVGKLLGRIINLRLRYAYMLLDRNVRF